MTNWTRAHDAWIAKHCEGFEVANSLADPTIWITVNAPIPLSFYNLDHAAAIRAAEAWRKKEPIWKHWSVLSPRKVMGDVFQATVRNDGTGLGGDSFYGEESDFAAALAQALYRATGGPA